MTKFNASTPVVAILTLLLVCQAALANGIEGPVEPVLNEYLEVSEARFEAGQPIDDEFCRFWADRLRGVLVGAPVDRWSYAAWVAVGTLENSLENWDLALGAWREARQAAPEWRLWFLHASDEYAALRERRADSTDDGAREAIASDMSSVVRRLEEELSAPGQQLEALTSRELAMRYLWLLHQEYSRLSASGDHAGAGEVAEDQADFASRVVPPVRETLSGWQPDDCYERAAIAYAKAGDATQAVRCVLASETVQSARMPASFHALNVFGSLHDAAQARTFFEQWSESRVGDQYDPELMLRYQAVLRSVPFDIRGEYAEPLVPFASTMLTQAPGTLAAADARYVSDQASAGIEVSGWRRSCYTSSLLALLARSCDLVGDQDGAFDAATDLVARFPDHPGCAWATRFLADLDE